jgi:hypothetical protein
LYGFYFLHFSLLEENYRGLLKFDKVSEGFDLGFVVKASAILGEDLHCFWVEVAHPLRAGGT